MADFRHDNAQTALEPFRDETPVTLVIAVKALPAEQHGLMRRDKIV